MSKKFSKEKQEDILKALDKFLASESDNDLQELQVIYNGADASNFKTNELLVSTTGEYPVLYNKNISAVWFRRPNVAELRMMFPTGRTEVQVTGEEFFVIPIENGVLK